VNRVQRLAAYNVCLDGADRLLLCRLSAITERPGWWTLPGGGVEFGEHPEDAALRELREETGIVGRIQALLAVDSIHRPVRAPDGGAAEYHSVRVVYRTDIDHAELVHEVSGSTDQAGWFTRAELGTMPLVEMGLLGVRLAYPDT
jgi:ADP-ribose pyrophosphatase YjhB (NUDIX family)